MIMNGTQKHMALAICTGCEIGKHLDVDGLCGIAGEVIEGVRCIKHHALCSENGLTELHQMVEKNGPREKV